MREAFYRSLPHIQKKKRKSAKPFKLYLKSRSQLRLSTCPGPFPFKVGCEDVNEKQTDKSNIVGAYACGHDALTSSYYHQGPHLQPRPRLGVNTNTKGAIESVRNDRAGVGIKRVMLFKSKRHLSLVQNTIKGIKEDISIIKCNISNIPKAVIPRTKSTETLKNKLLIDIFLNQNRSLHNLKNAKTTRN